MLARMNYLQTLHFYVIHFYKLLMMKITLNTKIKLINLLNLQIDNKLSTLRTEITDLRDSMKNDTKSSAGDKFETGREMMQIELNKKQSQINKLLLLVKDIGQIDTSKKSESIEFGSLIRTNKGNYFFSVAMGKVSLENEEYYALSMASPIGSVLKGKKVNNELIFKKQSFKILEIV